MNKHITFRGMEHSEALVNHANKHLEKIEKFLLEHDRTPISIEVILEAHPNHGHNRAEIRIKAPKFHVIAHRDGNDLYLLLNQITDIAFKQLTRDKQELVDRTHQGRKKELRHEFTRQELEEDDEIEELDEDIE